MKNKITIVCFLLLIGSLTIISIVKKTTYFSENENRVLADKPKLSCATILSGDYEKEYEDYLSDQMPFRNQWIYLKTQADRFALKNQVNSVYFAKDDYLIENQDYEAFTSSEAKENYEELYDFVNRYKNAYNVQVIIVPTKMEALEDKLPYKVSSLEDEIINEINNNLGSDNTVDELNVLKNHSKEYIYYRTDHHFTSLGAYYVAEKFYEEMKIDMPDYKVSKCCDDFLGTMYSKVNVKTKADEIYLYDSEAKSQVTIAGNDEKYDSTYFMEYLNEKDKYKIFLGGNNSFVNIKTDANSNRRLLLIKDSFAHTFTQFLVNAYDEIDVVDLRYYKENIDELIENNNYTDILIFYNISNLATDTNIFKLNIFASNN